MATFTPIRMSVIWAYSCGRASYLRPRASCSCMTELATVSAYGANSWASVGGAAGPEQATIGIRVASAARRCMGRKVKTVRDQMSGSLLRPDLRDLDGVPVGVLEPGRGVPTHSEHAIDGAEPGQVVVLEHHAAGAHLCHHSGDVGHLEARRGVLGGARVCAPRDGEPRAVGTRVPKATRIGLCGIHAQVVVEPQSSAFEIGRWQDGKDRESVQHEFPLLPTSYDPSAGSVA